MPIGFSAWLVNVTYERNFEELVFEVAQSPLPLLQAFYKALNPRTALQPSDLQVASGNRLSDVAVRVNLFGARGMFEVSPHKFRGFFEGLTTRDQLRTAADCIELAENTLFEVIPNVKAPHADITVNSWLACEGGTEAIQRVLGTHGGRPQLDRALEGLGVATIDYPLTVRLGDEKAGWRLTFALEESVPKQADLFFSCNARYSRDGNYGILAKQAEHFQATYLSVLRCFGLEPSRGET